MSLPPGSNTPASRLRPATPGYSSDSSSADEPTHWTGSATLARAIWAPPGPQGAMDPQEAHRQPQGAPQCHSAGDISVPRAPQCPSAGDTGPQCPSADDTVPQCHSAGDTVPQCLDEITNSPHLSEYNSDDEHELERQIKENKRRARRKQTRPRRVARPPPSPPPPPPPPPPPRSAAIIQSYATSLSTPRA